jgi:hypothetical protein
MARVPRAKPPEDRRQVSVSIPTSWHERADALAARMSPDPLVKMTITDVLRVAISRGLDSLEAEGPPSPRRVRPAKPTR